MNLTGGQFKGIKLEVPQNTRPTLSKVRESVFNILNQYDFKDYSFLDMFCGSGVISLEAISRGYNTLGLELNPKNFETIKKNYKKIKLEPKILLKNALNFKSEKKFEVIYIDPPWSKDYLPIIIKAQELLEKNGIIIIEYDATKNLEIEKLINLNNLDLKIIKSKKYGRCLIDLLAFKN